MTERAAFCQLMGNLAASMPKHFGGFTRSDSTRKWWLINQSDPVFDRHAVSNSCSYRRPSHLDALLSETVFLSALWCRRLPSTLSIDMLQTQILHCRQVHRSCSCQTRNRLVETCKKRTKEMRRETSRDIERHQETWTTRGQSIVTKHKLKAVKKQAG